jgi:hypothetical protein
VHPVGPVVLTYCDVLLVLLYWHTVMYCWSCCTDIAMYCRSCCTDIAMYCRSYFTDIAMDCRSCCTDILRCTVGPVVLTLRCTVNKTLSLSGVFERLGTTTSEPQSVRLIPELVMKASLTKVTRLQWRVPQILSIHSFEPSNTNWRCNNIEDPDVLVLTVGAWAS